MHVSAGLGLLALTLAGVAFVTVSTDCPDGITEGESYKPDGACRNCTCYRTGRKSTSLTSSCEECPTSPYYFDSTKCYSSFDNTLSFPRCCAPVVTCRGQDGFDEALLKSGDQK